MKNKIMLSLMVLVLGLMITLSICKKEEVKPKIEQVEEEGLSGYYKIHFKYNHNIQTNPTAINPISGNVIILEKIFQGPDAIVFFKGEPGQYIKFSNQNILGASSHTISYWLWEATPTGEIKRELKQLCCSNGYVYVYLD